MTRYTNILLFIYSKQSYKILINFRSINTNKKAKCTGNYGISTISYAATSNFRLKRALENY